MPKYILVSSLFIFNIEMIHSIVNVIALTVSLSGKRTQMSTHAPSTVVFVIAVKRNWRNNNMLLILFDVKLLLDYTFKL